MLHPEKSGMVAFITFDRVSTLILFLMLLFPLVSAFSISTAQASDDTAGLPKWDVGDSWRYRREQITGNKSGTDHYYVNVTSENVNLDMDNVEHRCYETVYEYQNDGSIEKHYFKKSDLREAVYIKSDGQKLFYKPLWSRINFPLEAGKTWDVHLKQYENTTGNPTAEINLTYECKGEEMVRVPAGDILAYKINRTDQNSNTSFVETYYSPEVENIVKKVYISKGKVIGKDELVDYNITEDSSSPGLPFFTVVVVTTAAAVIFRRKDR
ncbi:MAG: hypothetical protein ACQESD_05280 [Thermoplasmatota archaeon]